MRELAPVLHRAGPDATVAAYKSIASGDGVLPSATRTRQTLVAGGLVDCPRRDVVDGMQRRIVWMERALAKIKPPHVRLRRPLAGYAMRLRAIADQL